jgi:cytochrome b pre-mRNA-processing protein 3
VIFGLFGRRDDRRAVFYLDGGIPDTFEGRFESLTLHVFLVLRRLRELPAPAADLAQELVDACFAYLELGFRNGGTSDIAVPKRMKKIGQMFYGRVQAYEAALAASDSGELVAALRRNASPGEGAVLLAGFARDAQTHLARHDLDAILSQEALFPALAGEEARHV